MDFERTAVRLETEAGEARRPDIEKRKARDLQRAGQIRECSGVEHRSGDPSEAPNKSKLADWRGGDRLRAAGCIHRMEHRQTQWRTDRIRPVERRSRRTSPARKPATPVSEARRSGKPNEFGKMLKLQQAENQIAVDYETYDQRPSDTDLLIPARRTRPHSGARHVWWRRMIDVRFTS